MKKFTSLFLAVLMLLSVAGCSETAAGSGGNQGRAETPVVETHAGVILEHFTEGGGDDTAECLKVENALGEVIVFTITEDTVMDDFGLAAGVSVQIECETYSDSAYRPILSLTRATPVAVDVGDYYAVLSLPSDWSADEIVLASEEAGEFHGYGLFPVSAPEFKPNFVYFSSRVGICATGMTVTEFDLPIGARVYQYVEEINGTVWFHLYISFPEALDGSLVVQGEATPEQWRAYESELHDILMSLTLMSEDKGIDF